MKAKETVKLASLRAIKAAITLAKTAEGSNVIIYTGGNEPVVYNIPAGDLYKTDVSVPQNDGVVVVFQTE